MSTAETLITEYLDTWSSAIKAKSSAGRGNGKALEFYGTKKLRELILELAVRGLLVPQDPTEVSATELMKQIEAERQRLENAGINKKPKALPPVKSDEAPFELPTGWVFIRNGSLFGLRKGKVPLDLSESSGAIPYLDIEALDRGNVCRYTNDEEAPQSTDEDILVVCDGSRSGLVLDGKNGAIGSTLSVIETPSFIKAFIKIIFRRGYQRWNSTMKGAAIPHLDTKNLLTEVTGLPPLAEQNRIIAKVDELMALCDQLEQQQEGSKRTHGTLVQTLLGALTAASERGQFEEAWQLIESNFDTLFTTTGSIDQLKQTILQLAITGKLVEQDPGDEPASRLLEKLSRRRLKQFDVAADDSANYSVPSNWAWTALGNYAVCSRGRFSVRPRNDPSCYGGPYPFIQIGDLSDDGGPISSHSQTLNEKGLSISKMFKAGTVVTAIVGATIGNTGVLAYNMCFPDSMVGLETDDPIGNRYVEIFLLARKPRMRELSYAGGGQPNIKLSVLNPFPFPLPPLAEQYRIVIKVDELLTLCDRLKASLQTSQATQPHLADCLVDAAIN